MYPPQFPPHSKYPDWQGRKANKAIFASIAGALWAIALALPAFTDDTPGLGALIFGWTMIFDGEVLAFIAWMGNLPFLVGIFMFMFGRRPAVIRAALILSIIGTVFSFGAFTVDEVPTWQSHTSASPYLGCYTWVLSMVVLLVGVVIYYTKQSAIVNSRQ